jgi:hypothetical protein
MLCPVLFVCYGERVLGAGLSKQILSLWIVDMIMTAYRLAGKPVLGSVVAHSTRGVAASWALLRYITDMCRGQLGFLLHLYYWINVAPPSAVGSAVLGVTSYSGDCAGTTLAH